MLNFPLTK